jgi:hypothetical protein
MASKTIFDESEAERAKDQYAATLARMSLSELLYHVLTLDGSPVDTMRKRAYLLDVCEALLP